MINFLHLKHPLDIVSWRELLVKDWVLYVLGKRVGGVILPQIKVLSTTLSYTILNNHSLLNECEKLLLFSLFIAFVLSNLEIVCI